MVVQALILTVVAAAAEECVYRGVVYEVFSRLSNRWIGASLSSLLFAGMHVVPLEIFVSFTLFGLLCVYLRERTGSLFFPLLLHVVQNLFVTLVKAYH